MASSGSPWRGARLGNIEIGLPCLSSDAELSERRPMPVLAAPFARALDGLLLPLLSRRWGGT